MAPLLMIFFGFCTLKSLEDFCGLIFCEILSEVLEIWDGNPQASLNLVAISVYIMVLTLAALTGG